jgi:hypothetical protein
VLPSQGMKYGRIGGASANAGECCLSVLPACDAAAVAALARLFLNLRTLTWNWIEVVAHVVRQVAATSSNANRGRFPNSTLTPHAAAVEVGAGIPVITLPFHALDTQNLAHARKADIPTHRGALCCVFRQNLIEMYLTLPARPLLGILLVGKAS